MRSLLMVLALAVAATAIAATPAHAQAPAPTLQRPFNGDGGIVLYYVKTDKTADFESVIQKVKEALLKSDKPERKQQGASWRVFKAGAGPTGSVVYAFVIFPSVKNVDYSVGVILAEGFPTEAAALFKTYQDSLLMQPSQVVIALDLANDFSK